MDDELWRAVRDRKERTAQTYLRTATGQLLRSPETGVHSEHLLTGFARCGHVGDDGRVCGRRMLYWSHAGRRDRYRFSEHLKRGTCGNSGGPLAREQR